MSNNAIDYDHSRNIHTKNSPLLAINLMFEQDPPESLLDVGCGCGNWISAALQSGVKDAHGVDGVSIPSDELLFDHSHFSVVDLTEPLDLGRRFDLALCLEVAEHIDTEKSEILVENLIRHSDRVFFSAACPNQPGQHHVNCQWPSFWQEIFNKHGYSCDDSIRWRLWSKNQIEPWYKQNMFYASKDSELAGNEPRLLDVIHPEILVHMLTIRNRRQELQTLQAVRAGSQPIKWTIGALANSVIQKFKGLGSHR